MVVSDVLGSKYLEISILYSLLNIQPLIVYIYLRCYLGNRDKFRLLFVGLIASQIISQSIFAFHQSLEGGQIGKFIEARSDSAAQIAMDEYGLKFRPSGTFRHANHLAMYMAFWLSIIFPFVYKNGSLWLTSAFFLGLLVLALSLSRSAWIGFTVSILLGVFVMDKVKKVGLPRIFISHRYYLVAIIVLLMYIVIPRVEKSFYGLAFGGFTYRINQTVEAIRLVSSNTIFGVGSGMAVFEGLRSNPMGYFYTSPTGIHNWLLTITVEHGIPLFLIFVLGTIFAFKWGFSTVFGRSKSGSSLFNLGILCGVLAVLLNSLFQPYEPTVLLAISYAILTSINSKNEKTNFEKT